MFSQLLHFGFSTPNGVLYAFNAPPLWCNSTSNNNWLGCIMPYLLFLEFVGSIVVRCVKMFGFLDTYFDFRFTSSTYLFCFVILHWLLYYWRHLILMSINIGNKISFLLTA